MTELEQRLQRRGSDDEETIKKRLEIAQRELEQAKTEGFHDKIFINDDLETTYKQLENYIFGIEENYEGPPQDTSNDAELKAVEPTNAEVEMMGTDAPAPEIASTADTAGADSSKGTATDTESGVADGETS
jgi:THO complex subunit 1